MHPSYPRRPSGRGFVKVRPPMDLSSRRMQPAELKRYQAVYERAHERYLRARDARDAAIRASLLDSPPWLPVEIAETLGVSRQYVHQIIHAVPSDKRKRQRVPRESVNGPQR